MVKTLIVFEFKDEIDAFISQRSIDELRHENVRVLALMPESQVYLKQLQIPLLDTCDLFGKNGHEQALLQSDRIYQFAESLFNVKDDLGIRDGYKISFLFYTRLIVHYILWLIEIIDRCSKEECVKKIVCYSNGSKHVPYPMLCTNEGYIGEISKRIARKLNISFELFYNSKDIRYLTFERFKKYAAEIFKYIIYQVKFVIFKFLIGNKKIIIAPSQSYNLGRVLNTFKQTFKDVYVIYLNNVYSNKRGMYLRKLLSSFTEVIQLPTFVFFKGFKKRRFLKNLEDIVSRIENEQGGSEVFAYKDVAFKDIVLKKIKEDIIPSLREIYLQTIHLSGFLKKYIPAIIISQMARDVNYNLGELASMHEIPSLLISHGSHVPPENKYETIEWMEHSLGLINTHYQYVAIQSPWAKAFVDKIQVSSKQIITGPILFAKITKDKNRKRFLRESIIPEHKDKVILLHTDTPRIRGHFRFYVYQTVDEYISNLNSLISTVEEIKGLHLIIRFRPKYFLTRDHLENLLIKSDCYSINTDGAFEDYLSLADVLISYSSTTIEEALQNEVPVLLYDGDGKYCHIKDAQALGPLQKPEVNSCYYVNTKDNLKWALQWLLVNHFTKEAPSSLWSSHVFDDSEKTELVSYFNNYFAN